MEDSIYIIKLPFSSESGPQDNQVTFFADPNSNWSDRPIAPTKFVTDKQYWEILGKPDEITLAMSTGEGLNRIADLDVLLDAIEEVMGCDKGQSEEEWIEWCNKHLQLMKHHGRMKSTIEFV